MTQNIDTQPTALDFDAWLDGASLTEASVDIMQDASLMGRYADWLRRFERAAAQPRAERSMGEPDPMATIAVEGEALLAEVEASRSTWFVRGLTMDDITAIQEAFPDPPAAPSYTKPMPELQRSPTDAQARAYLAAVEGWEVGQRRHAEEHAEAIDVWAKAQLGTLTSRGAEKIARAVVRIEQGGRVVAESITADQARRLPSRLGEAQVKKILDAIDAATAEVPEVPLSPLSRGFGDDPE